MPTKPLPNQSAIDLQSIKVLRVNWLKPEDDELWMYKAQAISFISEAHLLRFHLFCEWDGSKSESELRVADEQLMFR
jgi:hypothetical protein